METLTVRLDDELSIELSRALAGGGSKSAFVRDAIKEKLGRTFADKDQHAPTWMERVTIYYLLEIIRNLKSQKSLPPKDLSALQGAAVDGFLFDFARLVPVRQEAFSNEVISEVRDILTMHRVLSNILRDLKDKTKFTEEDIRFQGFDGNEELEHFFYADFVLRGLEEFKESAVDHGCENTHCPILDRYRAMLREWKKCKNTYHLSKAEFEAIIEAGSSS